MDRDAIARAQRRRQAQEALEFELDRTRNLEWQIEEIVAELEGPRIDEEAFAKMAPEDAEAARAVLQPDRGPEPEGEWFELDEVPEIEAVETREETEEEIRRLQEEIAASRRCQEVLERYIEALGD